MTIKRFSKRTSSIRAATIALFSLSIAMFNSNDDFHFLFKYVVFFSTLLGLVRVYLLTLDIDKKGTQIKPQEGQNKG